MFGQPSFSGLYGGGLGGGGMRTPQVGGGPDYNASPMAGGTEGVPAETMPDNDTLQWGVMGQPLAWWGVIMVLLIAMSLLGGKR